ncbi:hypothetical protein AAFF_G00166490 [Aldrovandia affinis]|uniref:Glycosyltransferase family 92 protein n=1 Tax=Aldrovandia affinis TaxID=143900 RepID=A0AAD7W7Y2_9TELE|nr:hypothetical protein AAFF_G00166490 [Aldrovandia affinis]
MYKQFTHVKSSTSSANILFFSRASSVNDCRTLEKSPHSALLRSRRETMNSHEPNSMLRCTPKHKLLIVIMVICVSGWALFCFLQGATGWFDYSDPMFETEWSGQCGRNVTGETAVPVRDSEAFLMSAFLDERVAAGTLRVIGVAHRTSLQRLYCHVCTGTKVFTSPTQVLLHSDHFGFPYTTADFLCQVPKKAGQALAVSITTQRLPDPADSFLQIHDTARPASMAPLPRQFSVCISTLFGNYSNILQFVQSMEMYRILGAEKVFVYKTDCSPLLQKFLDHYSSQGLLEVVAWDVGRHLRMSNSYKPSLGPGDLHYHGQIAALNDCIYRNMASSTYVVLLDMDEVIVPRMHHSWVDMMAFLSLHHLDVASFTFENSVFRYDVSGDGGRFDIWPTVPGVNILRHVHREPLRPYVFNACKLVLNPRAVVWTSVHNTLWQHGATLRVPSSVARLHHYRSPDDILVQRSQLVRDTTLWKYSSPLIRNVNHTLSQVLRPSGA